MLTHGIKRTAHFANVRWHESTGEQTGKAAQAFDMVFEGHEVFPCNMSMHGLDLYRILIKSIKDRYHARR